MGMAAILAGFRGFFGFGTGSALPRDMNTKILATTFTLATFSLLFMGCGPNLISEGSDGTSGYTSYYQDGVGDGAYSCPIQANITPSDPMGVDGASYTGCGGTTALSKVKIKGQSPNERNICVYPVQFLNETQFVYKLDRNSQPMYSCYDSWSSPVAELDFPYTNYNGAVIVDYSNRVAMSSCLYSGQNCPRHAIGRVR